MTTEKRHVCEPGRQGVCPLADNVLDALVLIDDQGAIVAFNRSAEEMFGYTAKQAIRMNISRLMPPEYRASHKAGLKRYVQGGEGRIIGAITEIEGLRADGSTFPGELSVNVNQRDGKRTFIGVLRDTSRRKEAEHETTRALSVLRATLESTADGVLVVDLAGAVVDYNRKWVDMMGVPEEVLALSDGKGVNDFMMDRVKRPHRFDKRLQSLMEQPETEGLDVIEFKNGQVFERYAIPHRIDGQAVGRVLSFREITERRRMEAELREREEHFRLFVESSQDCICHISLDGRFLDMNSAGARYNELDRREELIGKSCYAGVIVNLDGVEDSIVRAGQGESVFLQYKSVNKKGHEIWWDSMVAPVRDTKGRVTSILRVSRNITERKKSEDLIRYMARRDALTGLMNRNRFHECLESALIRAERDKHMLALIYLDLDHFKDVNDSFGHSIGDMLLRVVAERIRGCVRQADRVGRLGGDEFAVLQTDIEDVADIARLVDRLVEAVSSPMVIEDVDMRVTPSIGIAVYPFDKGDPVQLLKYADIAMYQAKDRGRNNYQFYESKMEYQAQVRLSLQRDLRHALERKELVLYYQPQVDAGTGELVGMEALLRWNSPKKGLVSAGEFIVAAETSGLIGPISDWVLRAACAQIKEWFDAGLHVGRVAVNMSALQFNDEKMVESVRGVLSEVGVDPSLLELELTESMLMQDSSSTVSTLKNLRRLGISLAIDDFGTGYSSLWYLSKLPVDKLKIDRAFVSGIDSGGENRTIASAVIRLGHSLGMTVIAEGVETEEQAVYLRRDGCDQLQGYYVSHPLPEADVTSLLAQRRTSEEEAA